MEQKDKSLNQIKTFWKESNNLWKKKIKFFLPFTSSEQFGKSNVYIVMWRIVVLHVNKVSNQSIVYIIDVAIMEMQVKVYEN